MMRSPLERQHETFTRTVCRCHLAAYWLGMPLFAGSAMVALGLAVETYSAVVNQGRAPFTNLSVSLLELIVVWNFWSYAGVYFFTEWLGTDRRSWRVFAAQVPGPLALAVRWVQMKPGHHPWVWAGGMIYLVLLLGLLGIGWVLSRRLAQAVGTARILVESATGRASKASQT